MLFYKKKGAALYLQVVKRLPASDVRGCSIFCVPPDGLNVLTGYRKEESVMDLLNIVFSVLNLLATVIIGVIQVTWMISRDVFRSRPKAKHYFKNKKD